MFRCWTRQVMCCLPMMVSSSISVTEFHNIGRVGVELLRPRSWLPTCVQSYVAPSVYTWLMICRCRRHRDATVSRRRIYTLKNIEQTRSRSTDTANFCPWCQTPLDQAPSMTVSLILVLFSCLLKLPPRKILKFGCCIYMSWPKYNEVVWKWGVSFKSHIWLSNSSGFSCLLCPAFCRLRGTLSNFAFIIAIRHFATISQHVNLRFQHHYCCFETSNLCLCLYTELLLANLWERGLPCRGLDTGSDSSLQELATKIS